MLSFALFLQLVCNGQNAAGIQPDQIVDIRDSAIYQTIELSGKTWTQDNISFYAKGSDCYDHDTVNCSKFGRLYTFTQAQSACPEGWRLPKSTEWNDLISNSGGNKLAGGILKTGGISDFNIRMSGIRKKLDFLDPGQQTGFWGADSGKQGTVYAVFFFRSDSKAKEGFISEADYRLSVRCIKN